MGTHREVTDSDILSWTPCTSHSPGAPGGGYKPLPRRGETALFYHLRLHHESKGISCSFLSNLSTVLTSKKKKRTKERYYLMATKYLNQGHQPTAEPKRADVSQHEVGRAHGSLIITTGKRTGFGGETVVFIDPLAQQELTSMTHFPLRIFKPRIQGKVRARQFSRTEQSG